MLKALYPKSFLSNNTSEKIKEKLKKRLKNRAIHNVLLYLIDTILLYFFLNYKELLLLMQFNLKKFLDYSRNLGNRIFNF